MTSSRHRFRWTINLDPRYRVIAMVTALRSFDTAPGRTFAPVELQDECEDYWPAGFARKSLSSSEFLRYLDEMKGLGVLHRQGDSFGLRSPSIRGLLGTRDAIESELLEVAENLDVDQGYNPTMNRRLLDTQSKPAAERRSPLSDAELGMLVGSEQATVVVGTPALGIGRVPAALELVAAEAGRGFAAVKPADLPEALLRRSAQVHVTMYGVMDSTDTPATLEAAERARVNVTLVVEPDQLGGLGAEGDRVVQLHRWSLEALQSWQETPFSTPALRQRLKRVTGGWPELVELAMVKIAQGASPAAAIDEVGNTLSSSKTAQAFLESTGAPIEVTTRWFEWFGQEGEDGLQECSPATYDDLDAAGFGVDVRSLITQLQLRDVVDETPQGWVLDRAVTEAAAQLVA